MIFLFLGSVPFCSVKCTFVQKKIGTHAYFLSKSINFPKMYQNCFEQKNRTELFLVTIQTALRHLGKQSHFLRNSDISLLSSKQNNLKEI